MSHKLDLKADNETTSPLNTQALIHIMLALMTPGKSNELRLPNSIFMEEAQVPRNHLPVRSAL